jgi:nitroimidazol reductase NimA-like FMN-containing flavoprotein (pyridoxamine 5'-phosphate oxidase superfamily)
MWQEEGLVERLSEDDCWRLLRGKNLGRLALAVGGEIDIFPVNYHCDGASVLFRTAPGTKLLELTINSHVAFEADGFDDAHAWSVVLKGTAEHLDSADDIDEAESFPLTPWIPTLKYEFVRIQPTSVTGRRFERLPEPERY